MMVDMLERLKKNELQPTAEAHCFAGPSDVECDFCTGRKYKAMKSCLSCLLSYCEVHIQPHYEVPRLSKHKLVNATSQLQEKICSQHDRIIEVFCRTDQKLICMLCSTDDHNGHKTVSVAAEWTEKQKRLGRKKVGNQKQIQQREKQLQEVQQALETLQVSAQEAVYESERIFTELISFMEQKRSEVTESIRAQERAELSRAEGLLEQLEVAITKLKSRDAEMEKLLQTEDHIDFLKGFDSCCSAPVSEISSIAFTPHLSSTDIMTPALKEVEKMLLKFSPEHKSEVPVSQSGGCPVPTAERDHKSKVSASRSGDCTVPTAKRVTDIRPGDRVRVKASVKQTAFGCGWGVAHSSVGVVKCNNPLKRTMHVQFPEYSMWLRTSELELVP